MPVLNRPRRSALYLPASNARAIAKARTLPADVIILDLEDAVAPDAKAGARIAAVAAISEGGWGKREVVIRANGLDTPWGADDLAAIAGSGADGVLVPKVCGPEDILRIEAMLSGAPADMQLWAMIETCTAIPRLWDIAALGGSTRLSVWIMGINDLAKEMGAQLLPGREPFLSFLSMAVAAARCHGICVLDGVCNDFRDLDVFSAEASQGRSFGFDGKSLIHPAQIEPCNAIFSPSPADLARARSVIEAFALPENAGKGAVQVDGAMAELLHRDQAIRLVAMADAIAGAAQGAR